METLILEKEEGIGTVRFNRPEILNALNIKMKMEFLDVLDKLISDEDVGVVIFTGEGKAFNAGADVREWKSMIEGKFERDFLTRTFPAQVALKFKKVEKPTIAAVNGPAAGFGFNLILHCDFVIAAEEAVLTSPFVKRGIPTELGSTFLLPRLIGFRKAKQVVLLGDVIDAKEAERLGIVDKVVQKEDLMSSARNLARKLLKNAPLAMRMNKKLLLQGLTSTLEEMVILETEAADELYASEDFKEGAISFLEKREPKFKGR